MMIKTTRTPKNIGSPLIDISQTLELPQSSYIIEQRSKNKLSPSHHFGAFLAKPMAFVVAGTAFAPSLVNKNSGSEEFACPLKPAPRARLSHLPG